MRKEHMGLETLTSQVSRYIEQSIEIPFPHVDGSIPCSGLEAFKEQVNKSRNGRLLVEHGAGCEAEIQDLADASVVANLRPKDVIAVPACVPARLHVLFPLPGLVAAVDLFPRIWGRERQLVGGHADHRAVLVVEIHQALVHSSGHEGETPRERCSRPELWAGVLPQWVKVDIVKWSYHHKKSDKL